MTKRKAVLHELLAVEGDLDGAHKLILAETKNTFEKKVAHFQGQHRKLEMFVDDNITHPEIIKSIDTTVAAKLQHMQKTEQRYFDAMLQKEATNQIAKADLVVDGDILAIDLPATFLLGMETRLKHLRSVYMAIPTLAPGVEWKLDPTQGQNIYKAVHPEEKLKTETITKPIVLYEATKEHPAQVKETSEVRNTGKFTTNHWSGMITPAAKSALLGRVDKLIRACKQARQRANTTEVIKINVSKKLFEYIND